MATPTARKRPDTVRTVTGEETVPLLTAGVAEAPNVPTAIVAAAANFGPVAVSRRHANIPA
jgi:hypothetical protein